VTTILQCYQCRHFDRAAQPSGIYRCAAFERIPWEILYAEHDHRQPFPGDNGIRFEPVEPFRPLRPVA
jgi:hypothetical protein